MARSKAETLTSTVAAKDLGAVFTPSHIAEFLAHWAIRSPGDVVLDPGAGEGAFLLSYQQPDAQYESDGKS